MPPKNTGGVDLLLVNPSVVYKIDQEKILARRIEEGLPNQESPPIGIAYLLAIAKQNGLKAEFIDMVVGVSIEELLQDIRESKPLLIGFTAYTVQIKAAGFIANEIKRNFPDVLICCGGPHVTAMPKETLEEFDAFDFVVCGEGEMVLREIFENLKAGKPLSSIKGVVSKETGDFSPSRVNNLDALPFPAWEEFDLTKYPGYSPHQTKLELPMSTSRGCPFSCVFCARSLGRERRHRSIRSIIEEIERNINDFGAEAITFCDETFIINREWSKELFNTMISRGLNKKIKWACETRVDTTSPELFRLIKEAGCYCVYFGLESADDNILKNAKKGFTVSQIRKAVAQAKEAGLTCIGSFIIGLPGETEASVNKSIKLAKELDIYSTTFPIAVPLPGTELREMALKNEYDLRILTNNWDDYGKQYPGVMESQQLSMEKRQELQKKAYEHNPKRKVGKMTQTKERKREYMRDYMRLRREAFRLVHSSVSPSVTKIVENVSSNLEHPQKVVSSTVQKMRTSRKLPSLEYEVATKFLMLQKALAQIPDIDREIIDDLAALNIFRTVITWNSCAGHGCRKPYVDFSVNEPNTALKVLEKLLNPELGLKIRIEFMVQHLSNKQLYDSLTPTLGELFPLASMAEIRLKVRNMEAYANGLRRLAQGEKSD